MKRNPVLTLAMAAILAGGAHAALADEWQEHHPRRVEVNHRLANQDRRINHEMREGDMSPRRAARLHQEERQIRNEERNMAARHNGHITPEEQRRLNRQENRVSRQIGQ